MSAWRGLDVESAHAVLVCELQRSEFLHAAVQNAVSEVLASSFGSSVTWAQLNSVMPSWLTPFNGERPIAWFRFDQQGDHQDEMDIWFAGPESYGPDFWQQFGFKFHEDVVRLEDVQRCDVASLSLLTDGALDWWFRYYSLNDETADLIGEPVECSIERRREEILALVHEADAAVHIPGRVSTSLTKADFQWLKAVVRYPVRHRRSTLRTLVTT